ncbi:hypothetical protein RRG08_066040 [Elysia crispata]|uniref:Uncharacterized protein n=1 Tax=Elysia crispata TaxID=231223 RepID=A0AAE0Y3P6_9GAST|nr:hypothetical protein RRG08_066040 [Elysia crispata]
MNESEDRRRATQTLGSKTRDLVLTSPKSHVASRTEEEHDCVTPNTRSQHTSSQARIDKQPTYPHFSVAREGLAGIHEPAAKLFFNEPRRNPSKEYRGQEGFVVTCKHLNQITSLIYFQCTLFRSSSRVTASSNHTARNPNAR